MRRALLSCSNHIFILIKANIDPILLTGLFIHFIFKGLLTCGHSRHPLSSCENPSKRRAAHPSGILLFYKACWDGELLLCSGFVMWLISAEESSFDLGLRTTMADQLLEHLWL